MLGDKERELHQTSHCDCFGHWQLDATVTHSLDESHQCVCKNLSFTLWMSWSWAGQGFLCFLSLCNVFVFSCGWAGSAMGSTCWWKLLLSGPLANASDYNQKFGDHLAISSSSTFHQTVCSYPVFIWVLCFFVICRFLCLWKAFLQWTTDHWSVVTERLTSLLTVHQWC